MTHIRSFFTFTLFFAAICSIVPSFATGTGAGTTPSNWTQKLSAKRRFVATTAFMLTVPTASVVRAAFTSAAEETKHLKNKPSYYTYFAKAVGKKLADRNLWKRQFLTMYAFTACFPAHKKKESVAAWSRRVTMHLKKYAKANPAFTLAWTLWAANLAVTAVEASYHGTAFVVDGVKAWAKPFFKPSETDDPAKPKTDPKPKVEEHTEEEGEIPEEDADDEEEPVDPTKPRGAGEPEPQPGDAPGDGADGNLNREKKGLRKLLQAIANHPRKKEALKLVHEHRGPLQFATFLTASAISYCFGAPWLLAATTPAQVVAHGALKKDGTIHNPFTRKNVKKAGRASAKAGALALAGVQKTPKKVTGAAISGLTAYLTWGLGSAAAATETALTSEGVQELLTTAVKSTLANLPSNATMAEFGTNLLTSLAPAAETSYASYIPGLSLLAAIGLAGWQAYDWFKKPKPAPIPPPAT